MGKNKSNWWIDLALLGLFWISFFPDLTSLALHEWLGLAAIALAAIHLILHWNWVETVTLRFFSRAPGQARIYYLADLGVMLGFLMILITGLLISTWLDLPLYDMAAWTHIHLMVSVFTLGMVILKLILHWRWISSAVRRYAFEPVFGRTVGAPARAANPVSRRDFLKVSGVLGIASAVTIHGLFDHPSEAQPQSAVADGPTTEPVQPPTATSPTIPAGAESSSAAPAVTQTAPLPTNEPAAACIILCPNGCSYPGRCRRYVDRNGNNLCDNGECL
ncbi:MAG: twin-arginine translocation signal domain-containing protein [Anaerolineales bacterium]|nr:twin-arginine translocation signal domain-containing protein [Anaerolineales bacterium]